MVYLPQHELLAPMILRVDAGDRITGAFADAPKKNSVVFEPHLQYQSGLEGLALWRRGIFP